jgi:TrmH family RNA methyltransferase
VRAPITDPASPAITSARNPRVKAAVRLRDRRARDESGLTLVDGAREVARAIDAGVGVVEAFVCDGAVRGADALDAVAALRRSGRPVWQVTPSVLEKVAFGERSEGVVVVVRTPPTGLDRLELGDGPLLVVVEGVEKPGNLGAIVRTADAAGAVAVIAADPRTDLFNPSAIRASLGTIFAVGLASAPTAEVLAWLRRRAIRILAARVDAERLYTSADLRGPVAIILGSEAHGLGPGWTDRDIEAVRLPMLGVADSLNVAAAAAAILYEARRQRGIQD